MTFQHGIGPRFDYIQPTVPDWPEVTGVTWLDTDTYIPYVSDVDGNRWVSMGTPFHYNVSGPNSVAVGNENARFHEIVQSTAKTFRPYLNLHMESAFISNINVCHTSHAIQLRNSTTVLATIGWDGVNTFRTKTFSPAVTVQFEAPINVFLLFGSGTAPNRWSFGMDVRVYNVSGV